MKKILAALMSCALLLAGCAAAPSEPAPTPQPTPAATPAATATPAPTPTATPVPTPTARPEAEEKAEFLDFWEDAMFFYWVSGVPEETAGEPRYSYYTVVSNYLEHHTQRLGETVLYDTDGAPCFPYEDFLGAAQAIFGPDTDYTAYIPNDPGPEGTARALWGYGPGGQYAELDADSFVLQGEQITVQAAQSLRFPGEDIIETGTLTYTFAVQPDNEYCRYRLLSVEKTS